MNFCPSLAFFRSELSDRPTPHFDASPIAEASMKELLPTRVVRVSFTDTDATDSSSSDDENSATPKVKRYVTEIHLFGGSDNKRTTPQGGGKTQSRTKYRGVRRRQSGRWSAEIRSGTNRWLGTYDTAEEAAVVYDRAAISLKGPDAVTNFAWPSMAARKSSQVASPTSVLQSTTEQHDSKFGILQMQEPSDLSSSSDSLSMSDPLFVTNIFNEPMFFMDFGVENCFGDEKYVFDVPFTFLEEEDLASCKWDVDTCFQEYYSSII